jgi:hypothetical protein
LYGFISVHAQAIKFRATWNTTYARATAIAVTIKTDKAYIWANNDENGGKISELVASIKRDFSSFHSSFMAEDPVGLRRCHTADIVKREVKSLLTSKPKVSQLISALDDLVLQHQVVQKALMRQRQVEDGRAAKKPRK